MKDYPVNGREIQNYIQKTQLMLRNLLLKIEA